MSRSAMSDVAFSLFLQKSPSLLAEERCFSEFKRRNLFCVTNVCPQANSRHMQLKYGTMQTGSKACRFRFMG